MVGRKPKIPPPKEDLGEYPEIDRRQHERIDKKLSIEYGEYNVYLSDPIGQKSFVGGHTVNISQSGLLFNASRSFQQGALLKIKIKIPNYWNRKSRMVNYEHVASPKEMSILGKVVRIENLGSKKKHRIAISTVNIDTIDRVLWQDFIGEIQL